MFIPSGDYKIFSTSALMLSNSSFRFTFSPLRTLFQISDIGTDHIDLDYCSSHGIEVANASGCNAGGVMQYVFSALYGIAARKGIKIDGATIGIVGVGNVGRRIEYMADYLGFKVLRCDPPRAQKEGPEGFCSLEHLLTESDIVTLHVPLDENTRGMANADFFTLMKPGAIFINAAFVHDGVCV